VEKDAESSALSNKLLTLLRERVRENSRQELLDYIDELLPEYELPPLKETRIDDRVEYRLEEFLQYYDEDFIRFLYPAIFKREPDAIGMSTGLEALQVDKLSRVHLLGRFRYSPEGERHGVIIRGLRPLYFLVRLQKVPVLGRVLSAFTNLKLLDDVDIRTADVQAALAETEARLDATTHSLEAHIGTVERHLGHETVAANPSVSRSAESIRPPVALIDLLRLAGEDFVYAAYRIICNREPTGTELSSVLQEFHEGRQSKVGLLGELCNSAGVSLPEAGIKGLAAACRRDRVESIPVLGFLFRLPRLLFMLSRLDAILEYQDAQVASGSRQIANAEARLVGHYNSTIRQIKREALDAMQSDSDPTSQG
jgi:Domain of unknown function (DUF4214)